MNKKQVIGVIVLVSVILAVSVGTASILLHYGELIGTIHIPTPIPTPTPTPTPTSTPIPTSTVIPISDGGEND